MEKKRFIMVGFDGANPEMVARFLPHLPNFKRLIPEGSWGAMLSCIPADTPTNWTALATGATAATSRITGFELYMPGESLKTMTWGPEGGVASVHRRFCAAEFLWEAADRQGRKSLIVNYPFAWHSKDLKHGVIVGGDSIVGGQCMIRGAGCFCTTDRLEVVSNATPVELIRSREGYVGQVDLSLDKERIWTAGGEMETGRTVRSETERALTLRTIPGSSPRLRIEESAGQEVASLAPGEWGGYKGVQFGDQVGWVRFLLVYLSEDGSSLQVYHSMITRGEGWTKPARYARVLTRECGPYQQGEETGSGLGWHHWGGRYEAEAYAGVLSKTGEVLVGYCRRLAKEMPDWDHMYVQLHSNDGLNHLVLGHLAPHFPGATLESKRRAELLLRENYVETDRILGKVAKLAEEYNAILIAVSDHSAVPTHTWVDTARPFLDKGWVRFDEAGNWEATLSKIRQSINNSVYINLKGRQPDGIVEPDEYEALRDEIISTLMGMRDPKTGLCPIALAARREDLDALGGNGESFGDVIYFMRPGYTNWPASKGSRLTRREIEELRISDPDEALDTGYTYHAWLRGNHHEYLPNAEYPGLCSNRAILLFHGPGIRKGHRIRGARTIDVTPTLAYYTEIEPPEQSEGHVLGDVFER